MRKSLRVLTVLGLVTGLLMAFTLPASATVHEIVASFCAATSETGSPTGHLHDPPGLTPAFLGGTSAADNIAQPLLSSGAFLDGTAEGHEPLFNPATEEFDLTVPSGETVLLVDETAPQVKLAGSGMFFYDPVTDVYVEIGLPTPESHPAFAHCPNLPELP
ncbi:MAG: hypothetical protein R3320_15025 [Nitriliruptorales bacterium]|nr:hypothetical protein [Nitriliruptorales bacterium]